MGLLSRFLSIFNAKASKALDRVEDPTQQLDYSYEKQLDLLRNVKRGLADIATSKQRLKMQADRLQQEDAKLEQQAQQAVSLGRDDLAREALLRRQALQPQLTSLSAQVEQLNAEQNKLADASQRLQTQIDVFRTQKESLKARYTAANARVKIDESFTGLGKNMNDIGLTVQRAQDRIEQMDARAGAIDQLIDSGALTDLTAQLSPENDLDRQLRLAGGTDSVDAQLAAMKAQLPDSQPKQLESHEQKPNV